MTQPKANRPARFFFIGIFFIGLWLAGCGDGVTNLSSDNGEGDAPETPMDPVDARPNIIVVLTDDQGYADLGVQGVLDEVQTPRIDGLARDGVRMTAGYVTAPQCSPSRAALLTGRYQQRYGLDDNAYTPLSLSTDTVAQRLKACGYATGFVGKWHLEIDNNSRDWFAAYDPSGDGRHLVVGDIPLDVRRRYFPDERGFDDVYFGYFDTYWRNFDLDGGTVATGYVRNSAYRIDVVTDAALAFIHRRHTAPFFLVVSYYAPHVPLAAPERYLEDIPANLPVRRRYALAMLSAIDAGVGAILDALAVRSMEEDTLIFFISDNGAPLGIDMQDLPVADKSGAWDGSRNDPWLGEKGMLSEGGIRVPFLMQWKGTLPAGKTHDGPVSTLDVASTALSLAQSKDTDDLDGIDLMPILTHETEAVQERPLFWRFWRQAAVRKGKWKYLLVGDRELLFDINDPDHEHEDVLVDHPDIAATLKAELSQWAAPLERPGISFANPNGNEIAKYNAYFDLQLP